MKLAAFEGLRTTETGAPEHLLGWYDATARSSTGSGSPSCSRCSPSTTRTRRCKGLDTVPPDDRPPVNVVRFAFQTMVGIGTLLAVLGVGVPRRARCGGGGCPSRRWFYRALVARRAGSRSSR